MIQIGIDYYPEHWDASLWEKDLAQMEAIGVSCVRVAEFAWAKLEPQEGSFDFAWLDEAVEAIARHGMKVILCTPTNCPPDWLYRQYPDCLQWNTEQGPTYTGIRGHRCQSSPVFRGHVERIVSALAQRYANHPAVYAWQLDNEIETNQCVCPSCREKFQAWCREKYGTLENLNRCWGTDVWSGQYSDWSQLRPHTKLAGYQIGWYNPAYILDWERFGASVTAEYAAFQAGIIRRYKPDAIITTNACFSPVNQTDLHLEFQSLNVAAYDNYPPVRLPEDSEEVYSAAFGLDLIRGLKRKNFWILEQLGGPGGCWGPMAPNLEPGMLEGYALQAVAHGADLGSFFRWRTAVSGAEMFCHGLLDHSGKPNRRLRELCQAVQTLQKHPYLDKTTLVSPVALLYGANQEFALRSQRQSDGCRYWTQPQLLHEACGNLGVNVDVIEEAQSLAGYHVVLVPVHTVVNAKTVENLYAFARDGGTVVLTDRCGVKNEYGNCIGGEELPTVFAALAGCHVEEYDPIGQQKQEILGKNGKTYAITSWCDLLQCDSAKPIARYLGRYYDGTPAITKNSYGKGCVYYIGTVGEKAMYRDLLLEIFRALGIAVQEQLPRGVEITTRSGEGGTYRFTFNNTAAPVCFPLGGEEIRLKPLEMRIDVM